MKVLLATNDFSNYFERHYPDLEVYPNVSAGRMPKMQVDLVIFTGGEDLNPAMYGERPNGTDYFNKGRDEQERNVWYLMGDRTIKTKKILGVCRGHQFLNVMMGGNLHQDLYRIKSSHSFEHDVVWSDGIMESLKLPYVNSMHHQAIRNIGDNRRYVVLAKEPKTEIIESITWFDRNGEERYLGVQFHPEFMDREFGGSFFDSMEKWANGENIVSANTRSVSLKTRSKKSLNDYKAAYNDIILTASTAEVRLASAPDSTGELTDIDFSDEDDEV